MWESIGCELVVAGYCRVMAQAEKAKAPGYILTERRRLADSLGLTPVGMAHLRWQVDDAGADVEPEAEQKDVLDIRERLKAVE